MQRGNQALYWGKFLVLFWYFFISNLGLLDFWTWQRWTTVLFACVWVSLACAKKLCPSEDMSEPVVSRLCSFEEKKNSFAVFRDSLTELNQQDAWANIISSNSAATPTPSLAVMRRWPTVFVSVVFVHFMENMLSGERCTVKKITKKITKNEIETPSNKETLQRFEKYRTWVV